MIFVEIRHKDWSFHFEMGAVTFMESKHAMKQDVIVFNGVGKTVPYGVIDRLLAEIGNTPATTVSGNRFLTITVSDLIVP